MRDIREGGEEEKEYKRGYEEARKSNMKDKEGTKDTTSVK